MGRAGSEKSGPYLHLRDGKFVKEQVPGPSGGHGKQHEFLIVNRAPEHPIMQGLPAKWMHATDELYHALRGPAENITVLGSAYSSKDMGGTGEDEPLADGVALSQRPRFSHGPRPFDHNHARR